jgi:hypothetical protein
MATQKNQAVRLGRVDSSNGDSGGDDIYEVDIFGLLVEELDDGTNIKIDSLNSEDGEILIRD